MGSSTGWFNCLTLTGVEAGKDRFTWSNGRKSTLKYVDTIRAGVSKVTGRFIRGQFKGLRVQFDGVAGGDLVSFCASPDAGELQLFYAGIGRFGSAL